MIITKEFFSFDTRRVLACQLQKETTGKETTGTNVRKNQLIYQKPK